MLKNSDYMERIIKTDVLVVGSEGAGARAAIAAAAGGKDVILVTKGNGIGRSGATITAHVSNMAVDSRSATQELGLSGDKNDSVEAFFEDIVIEGKYVNDQRQAQVMAEEIPARARELADWGLKWEKVIGPSPGHRFPRSCYAKAGTGPAMLWTMKKVIKNIPNIRVMPNILITDLLTDEGRVTGAVGLELKAGEFIVFSAKAVVLATGGGQNVFPHVSGPHDLTGDGQVIAYRAGVELVDMEFIQFIPCNLLWPPGWNFARHGPMPYLLAGHMLQEPWIFNRLGKRYLKQWDQERVEFTTRDVLSIATAVEIEEGRASKHGGVYFSLKHLPDSLVDYYGEWGPCPGWKSATGFDFNPLIEQMKDGLALELGN